MAPNGSPSQSTTDWHIALIGGFKPRGAWQVKARTIVLTLLGGATIDLRQANFTSDVTEITNVSLIGGMDLTVPKGIRIETGGFRLFGGVKRRDDQPASPADRVITVRSFGILGGIDIHS
jgi:hypothetical protein